VTYNGLTSSNAFPVTVVESNWHLHSDFDGQGRNRHYPDYSLVSPAKASNCGGHTPRPAPLSGRHADLWATGLGPVNGATGWGRVRCQHAQRSLDAIGWRRAGAHQLPGAVRLLHRRRPDRFQVPQNVATGCAVPLTVQIGNEISNSTVIAVATAAAMHSANPAITHSVMQAAERQCAADGWHG